MALKRNTRILLFFASTVFECRSRTQKKVPRSTILTRNIDYFLNNRFDPLVEWRLQIIIVSNNKTNEYVNEEKNNIEQYE